MRSSPNPLWHVFTLGEFRLQSCGRDFPGITHFRTKKTAALLAYLVRFADRSHLREELIDLFWPDASPAEGKASLRTALASLRRQLEPPSITAPGSVLHSDRLRVGIMPGSVSSDVSRFLALAEGRAMATETVLADSVAEYAGPFLPGFYEDWVLQERGFLEARCHEMLERLFRLRLARGDGAGAQEAARRAIFLDPTGEEGHLRLIQALAETGQVDAARRQYAELERVLRDERGTAPSTRIRARAEQLLGNAARTPAVAAAIVPPRATETTDPVVPSPPGDNSGYLPLPHDAFFGRDAEIQCLTRLLGSAVSNGSVPLVTITGPGGAGKTRLALETAARLRGQWPRGGAWFVPLAEARNAAGVAEAIRDALRLPRDTKEAGNPLEQAKCALAERPALVVLDNFEQIGPDGSAVIAALLQRCQGQNAPPEARSAFLVTSRRRLALPGERVLPLAPLPTPAPEESRPEVLAAVPSVALFLDRARAGRPDFQVTARTAPAIAALCARLEGVPLALELAAAWSSVLGPSGMLEQLEARYEGLLTAHPADRNRRPARHRTLTAAIAWSANLLSPPARRLFAQLSVFHGGWTLEAAEAVVADAEGATVADLLAHLCERSLVRLQEDPATGLLRFGMLNSLQTFAAGLLFPTEKKATAERHARYFLRAADSLCQTLEKEHDSRQYLDAVEADLENYRAALIYLLAPGGDSAGAGKAASYLAACMLRYWITRGRVREGRHWLERAIKHTCARDKDGEAFSDLLPPGARDLALNSLGKLALRQGDVAAAQNAFEAALREPLTGLASRADTLNSLGNLAARRGDMESARTHFEQVLVARRQQNDAAGIAVALNNLGNVAYYRGDDLAAVRFYEECIVLRRAGGETYSLALSLSNLGMVLLQRSDAESLNAARRCHEEALRLRHAAGERTDLPDSLEAFALLALRQEEFARAARLAGAAFGRRQETGVPQTPVDQERFEAEMSQARQRLGVSEYAAAFSDGENLSWEDAVAYALESESSS